MIVLAMALSGALAGCMAINEILGAQHRLILNFTAGYGFTGIAVALMGRNHPVGIMLAALLFGALYQGGRSWLSNADHQPRHGGGHPGADHPVFRRAGAHVPPAAGARCSRKPAPMAGDDRGHERLYLRCC